MRGSARSRDQQGYYLLEGRLVMHDVASQTEQARMVSLPLARQYSIRLARFYSQILRRLPACSINTMRRDSSFLPIRLKRSFIWIAQQAQCGTAA